MGMSLNNNGEIQSRARDVEIFSLLFFVLFLIFLLFNEIIRGFFSDFLLFMNELSTPEIPDTLVRFNYLGFILPLVISILAVIGLTRSNSEIQKYWIWLLVTVVALIVILLYSSFVHELRYVNPKTHSGAPNYIELIVVLFFVGYLVWFRLFKAGYYLSYILGYIVGFFSDLESVRYLTKVTVFGGGGLIDADFAIPLIIYLSLKLTSNQRLKRGKTVTEQCKNSGK